MPDSPINEEALTAAHKAIEDVLIEFRDRRISVLNRANGRIRNLAGTAETIAHAACLAPPTDREPA